jgi:hypothetical protein
MKLQLFNNMRGIIYGNDPKRIGCDTGGILKIGDTDVKISAGEEAVMPTLLHGGTGLFKATYTDTNGKVYNLEAVTIRGGRIEAPPPVKVELMELRFRADRAEEEREALREKTRELENIFDTNSLNFLIR